MTQNVIYYPQGCYGTFVNWALDNCNNTIHDVAIPFGRAGNSHQPSSRTIFPDNVPAYFEKQLGTKKIVRMHEFFLPGGFRDYNSKVQQNLEYMLSFGAKIIVLYYTTDSVLWRENNILKKIYISEQSYQTYYEHLGFTRSQLSPLMTEDPAQRFRIQLSRQNCDVSSWGKKHAQDLEDWELRDFLSQHYINANLIQAQQLSYDCPGAKFVAIETLRDQFVDTIASCAEFFGIDIHRDFDLEFLHQQWREKQQDLHKDLQCRNIVEYTGSGVEYHWDNLSIVDEAWIQKQFRELGTPLNCLGLNVFPNNTRALAQLTTRKL